MKQFLLLLFITVTLYSCKVVQIIETQPVSTNIGSDNQYYYFENDTMKIVYVFWGAQGHMSFIVRNKLDIPIYIDWKKSSCIMEQRTASYYSEMEQSNFSSKTRSVGTSYGRVAAANSTTSGSGVTVKAERVTFVAPKAHVERTFGKLTDYGYITVNKNTGKEVKVNGKKGKQYIMPSGFMPFRNFITYSTTEDFKKEQYVDNSFSVNKVTVIKGSDFGKFKGGAYEYYFTDPKSYHTQLLPSYEIYK